MESEIYKKLKQQYEEARQELIDSIPIEYKILYELEDKMNPKFEIKDLVEVKSTSVVGMIISIMIKIVDTGYSISYEVSYPDVNNHPEAKSFYECELEKVESKKFGF